MKLISVIVSTVLIMICSLTASGKETSDILDHLPAIIAASTLSCDLDNLKTCKTKTICTRSDGYWYSNKCNLEPRGLVMIQRLSGIWDFNKRYGTNNQYSDHDIIRFKFDSIKSIGSDGDYEIKGRDITYSFVSRNVTARYLAADDIVLVSYAKGTTSILGKDLTLFPQYWYLGFVSSRELVGLNGNFPRSVYVLPENPAWATKR